MLTSFVRKPDVAARLKPLRPPPPRRIPGEIQVRPRTKHYALIGSAFDYLLRFELQRRAPHATGGKWVAERAPVLCQMLHLSVPGMNRKELAHHQYARLREAKEAVSAYQRLDAPSEVEREGIAVRAIRLAKLDLVRRAGKLDADFDVVDGQDVHDLLAMLAIVPFNLLRYNSVLLLNPAFGESSQLVGGADCDLVVGDCLIDIKTTHMTSMEGRGIDQLLGYFMLARNEHRAGIFPLVTKVAFYFARYGCLWALNAASRPGIDEAERFFIDRARSPSRYLRAAILSR